MSILETRNICKIYPGTVALNDVSVSFESGKVHALIGKNGSGKSTLLKLLSGAIQPSKGEIFIDGISMNFKDPVDSFSKGIATVYQELSLVQGLTIAENIYLGRMPMKGKLIDWKKTKEMAKNLLAELNIDLSVDEMVYKLSVGQCQMVEIAKAMSFNPKVLMLDEPTSALAQDEVKSLFKVINDLKKKEVIIIYVTHKLHELWEVADTCTILRDGKFVATVPTQETARKDLIKMMFGDVEISKRPENLEISDEVVLEVKGLTRKNKFNDISFKLRKGEILGIAGMMGSGRTELLRSIFGADTFDSGEIYCNGKKIEKPIPEKMKNEGVALTPEDRKREGLIQINSVKRNLCMASINKLGDGLVIDKTKEQEFVNRQINDLQIQVPNAELLVSSLSGGNQQKVVVGNWLNTSPKVMLFDEPSRGIDVNAKQQIFHIMWNQSRKGISSIMVSSELEELLEVCHRILILRDGEIKGEYRPEDLSIEELYSLCMGGE